MYQKGKMLAIKKRQLEKGNKKVSTAGKSKNRNDRDEKKELRAMK